MNNKILQRVIEELKKKEPSIPYVLGMLETLSEMTTPVITTTSQIQPLGISVVGTSPVDDEHLILDAQAKSKLSEVIKNSKYE